MSSINQFAQTVLQPSRGNFLDDFAHSVQSFVSGDNQQPNPYPDIKSSIPTSDLITQQTPGIQSPIPQSQVVPHAVGISPFAASLEQLKQDANDALQNRGMVGFQNASSTLPNAPVQQLEAKANPSPKPSYQQNITIPASHGNGKTQVPSSIAQVLMNSFGDIGEATNAAQVLHHPADNPYLPGDPETVNHITYGENGSFKTIKDTTNDDGSIDRGLMRINSNSFNGMMARHPDLANAKGIYNWDDMNDPQKNADMARLIYNEGGWRRWFAAPRDLRAK